MDGDNVSVRCELRLDTRSIQARGRLRIDYVEGRDEQAVDDFIEQLNKVIKVKKEETYNG